MSAASDNTILRTNNCLVSPQVPMDKCYRHDLKNFMLARRRNNTASRMLGEQLHSLEEKYCLGYKQFLRERSRVQEELRYVEDITSEMTPRSVQKNGKFKSQMGNNHLKSYSNHQDFQSLREKQKLSSYMQTDNRASKKTLNLPSHRFQCLNNITELSNPRCLESVTDEIDSSKVQDGNNASSAPYSNKDGLHISEVTSVIFPVSNYLNSSSGNVQTSEQDIANCTTIDEKINNRQNTIRNYVSPSRHPHVPQSHVFCKYSPEPHTRFLCNHFPCVTPTTYHTIDPRRADKCSTIHEMVNSTTFQTIDKAKIKLPIGTRMHQDSDKPIMHQDSDNPIQGTFSTVNRVSDNTDGSHTHNDKTIRLTPSWGSHLHYQRPQIHSVNEPPFSPMAADLILEHVRNGTLQPVRHNRTRTSVRDKIRGLNQLASEMRARNDRTKPPEWTVNYGQHLPSRILLNPVLHRSDI